jgi:hypothetical protein
MIRRTVAITVFVALAMACAVAPALAYGPHLPYTADPGARLVGGASDGAIMWSAPGPGATSTLQASRFSLDGAAHGPFTVAADISGLDGWHATGEGLRVTVVWKAGSSVFVKQVELAGGTTIFGPVTLSADGTVVPAGVAADGSGGAYVWLASALTPDVPNILNHVSATGQRQVTTGPGAAIANGTIVGLDVDSTGHAFLMLGSPGRKGLAVQRYATDLTHWGSPVSVYGPFEQPSAATQEPIGISASSTATVAWREGSKVRLQRFSASGLLWMYTTQLAMTGAVRLMDDGLGGVYVVGPSAHGLIARHVLASGLESGAPGSRSPDLGLGQPRVDGVTVNRAGDLFVACSDAGAPASRVELMTALGAWSDVGPTTQVPGIYSGAAPDGSGGAFVLGSGGGAGPGAVLWRIADSAPTLTFRPRSQSVQYGKSVIVAGYSTLAGGLPASSSQVLIGGVKAGAFTQETTATADGTGYYQAALRPTANATWTARAGGVQAGAVEIKVMPRVTLALSHLKAGTRLTETFSGSISPRHAGSRVLVQKAVGSGWRTVASGRLNSSSRYRVTWVLPYKTATYKLRVAILAHADHAEGVSQTATLRVVIRKG